jgi:hypothetical protein
MGATACFIAFSVVIAVVALLMLWGRRAAKADERQTWSDDL